jgi:hypothetical protein
MAANHSQEHMKAMNLQRQLYSAQNYATMLEQKVVRLQKKIAVLENQLRGDDRQGTSSPCGSHDSNVAEAFRQQVRRDIVTNFDRELPIYSEAMRDFAFIVRSMCPKCYEFIREFIKMPTLNNLDKYYKAPIDTIDKSISDIEYLPELLATYRVSFITEDYNNAVHLSVNRYTGIMGFARGEPGTSGLIPFVLGVDAMAIEPYCVPRGKVANTTTMDGGENPETPKEPQEPEEAEEVEEQCAYFFVYYLMPLDPDLPKIVVSVLPKKNGSASEDTIALLDKIKAKCLDVGFWVVAASGDGDHKYDLVIKQLTKKIRSDVGRQRTYESFVQELVQHGIEGPLPFITDFLHFAKCLRRRLANHPLSMIDREHCFTAEDVARWLGIGHLLDRKSPGAQLKDSIAMAVFNIENLVELLRGGHIDAAIYFMPIVLWRLANQGLNITRPVRVQLLKNAFEVMRRCDWQHKVCQMRTVNPIGEPVYLYREEDIEKMLSSLVVLGYILRMPIEKINMSRLGTCALEHLFGVTRLGTRGNNGAIRIRRHLARSCFIETLAHKYRLSLTKTRTRNLGGTIDSMKVSDAFFLSLGHLPLTISRGLPVRNENGFMEFRTWQVGVGESICQEFLECIYQTVQLPIPQTMAMIRYNFEQILELVKDGQNNKKESTRLAGHAIMARISELAKKE